MLRRGVWDSTKRGKTVESRQRLVFGFMHISCHIIGSFRRILELTCELKLSADKSTKTITAHLCLTRCFACYISHEVFEIVISISVTRFCLFLSDVMSSLPEASYSPCTSAPRGLSLGLLLMRRTRMFRKQRTEARRSKTAFVVLAAVVSSTVRKNF